MIALPLWLTANWKALAGAIIGAALCAPLAYCEGKSAGKLATVNANLEASLKVQQAALKVERAANLADMARRAKTAEQITELREIVTHEGTNDTVGGATGALLDRLRRNAR
ncbi:hypothetical protein M527_06385 [Sphingobium indicum IP26]|uniref:Uncharacterized protein n=1 Tax=Sphingobium indicum F2 TaxID=1450518 RepID=A0A8E1C3H9_9SPHN|nr:hypothetical protein [Sphingobium indicum]EPR09752.1 hypothetical protein M527_06385 [Sphingobium indicum IP26]KER37297.1 hypothetical protein AL00_06410 [Sphingobium indicum F2]